MLRFYEYIPCSSCSVPKKTCNVSCFQIRSSIQQVRQPKDRSFSSWTYKTMTCRALPHDFLLTPAHWTLAPLEYSLLQESLYLTRHAQLFCLSVPRTPPACCSQSILHLGSVCGQDTHIHTYIHSYLSWLTFCTFTQLSSNNNVKLCL